MEHRRFTRRLVTPLHKDLTIQAYLKLKDAQEAKNGYEALQWL